MGAVFLRARSDLRSHWRTWATLALLVGLVGGAVTAAAAGARRTDSAYGRFLAATRAPDLFAYSSSGDPSQAQITPEQFAALPQVAEVADVASFPVVDPADALVTAPVDDRQGRTLLRHKMLSGRSPRADRVDEAMVSFTMADRHHLGVGDTIELPLATTTRGTPQQPVTLSFRIVGIEASASEFPPQLGTGINNVWATPAFYRAVTTVKPFITSMVRLRHGAHDVGAFEEGVQKLAGGKPASLFALSAQAVNTQHSIHLQAVALWALAALFALAGVLVVAQLLIRQTYLESGEYPTLAALGMSQGQRWAVGMARAAAIALTGGTLAVIIAVALSPLAPFGLARTAEPHPGLEVDPLALALGALATVALVAAAGAWPAWGAAVMGGERSPFGGSARSSAVAKALARTPAPVAVVTGVRLALEPGRGRTAVPVRSALTGTVIAVVALTTAVGFTASLDHLLATPALYGVTWGAHITTAAADDVGPAVAQVVDDPDVTDVSSGYAGFPVTVGSTQVDGIALEAQRGSSLLPTAIEGRLPTRPGEVLLGGLTMAALHAPVGSTIRASVAEATAEPVALRVVGRGVFPSLSDSMGLGKGLAMTPDGLRATVGDSAPPPDSVFVRFRRGIDPARITAELQRRLEPPGAFTVLPPERPVDLVNFGRVQTLPLVLGGVLGAFAVITLVHLLVTSIRRRRRDLAVLKTLGLASGQVRATIAWQATTLSTVAVVVGVPLGVAAGRWVWLLFAHELGIIPEPVVPFLALATLIVGTVVVANLVAVLPGRIAARTRAAVVLRSE